MKIDEKEVRQKLIDILYDANGTGSGADGCADYILSLLAKQHEESFKAGRKEIEKELMCELRDPCGTIWEHAKMLQDKLEKQQAEHKALMKKIEKMIVEISIYDDHSSKCYNEIMELLKNVGV